MGIAPELSDAELVSLAVLQALLGFDSEARFVRYAKAHLTPWFPYVPQRPGFTNWASPVGWMNRTVNRTGFVGGSVYWFPTSAQSGCWAA